MAYKHYILMILSELEGYYRYNYKAEQLEILCIKLQDLTAYQLRLAADRWMENETRWLPKLSNLLEMVHQLKEEGSLLDWNGEPRAPIWKLLEGLKSIYHHRGDLEWSRWSALLDLARLYDRPHIAESIQSNYETLKKDQDQMAVQT